MNKDIEGCFSHQYLYSHLNAAVIRLLAFQNWIVCMCTGKYNLLNSLLKQLFWSVRNESSRLLLWLHYELDLGRHWTSSALTDCLDPWQNEPCLFSGSCFHKGEADPKPQLWTLSAGAEAGFQIRILWLGSICGFPCACFKETLLG